MLKTTARSLRGGVDMENQRTIGMLASNARECHFIYQYDIAYKMLAHKHLSVTMPPVIGLDPLMTNLVLSQMPEMFIPVI